MDWNWFFSALAQSTAAIVGLMGAFVFTKVVNNQAAFQESERSAEDLLLGAEDVRSHCGLRSFEWYNERRRVSALKHLDERLEEGDLSVSVDDLPFSPFDDPQEVRDLVEQHVGAFEPKSSATADFSSVVVDPEEMRWLQDQVRQEEDAIWRAYSKALGQQDRIGLFMKRTSGDPYASPVVSKTLVGLALLFLTGVLYPLGILPAPEGDALNLTLSAIDDALFSVRGALLAVVGGIFGWLLIALHQINQSLVFESDTFERLKQAMESEWYSEYFKRLEDREAMVEPGGDA